MILNIKIPWKNWQSDHIRVILFYNYPINDNILFTAVLFTVVKLACQFEKIVHLCWNYDSKQKPKKFWYNTVSNESLFGDNCDTALCFYINSNTVNSDCVYKYVDSKLSQTKTKAHESNQEIWDFQTRVCWDNSLTMCIITIIVNRKQTKVNNSRT